MNGYFISITNNLLEPKHYEAMGSSVWLYMWLIDKMTDISEGQGIVNYGNPITYEQVRRNFGSLSERTYYRMVATLRDAGYINTQKAKLGLYITINKAKKQFNKKATSSSAKNGKSGAKKELRPAKYGKQDLPNMAERPAKSGKSLYRNTNTVTNTLLPLDKSKEHLGDAAASYGRPDVNELFDYWQQTVGYQIKSQVKPNRNAATGLIKSYGVEDVKRLIVWVSMAQGDRYATKEAKAADFVDLRRNVKHVYVWAKGKAVGANEVARF